MRKFIAILLLAALLFNTGGYRIVFSWLENGASARMVARLDRLEYDESELIEVKVPINLPYQTDWKEFERFDGEIEINGVHYNYVKRKVQQDSLVLLCIPNTDKMKLHNAREEFFSLVNNLQQNNDNKSPAPVKSNVVKSITSDYCNDINEIGFSEISVLLSKRLTENDIIIPTVILSPEGQPPESIA